MVTRFSYTRRATPAEAAAIKARRAKRSLPAAAPSPEDLKGLVADALAALPEPKDGERGAPGRNGKDGAPGPRGPAGAPGKDGKDGVDGWDGFDGKDGARGPAGKDGRDGEPGPRGPSGAAGKRGAMGADGKDGAPGKDGSTILTGPRDPKSTDGKNTDLWLNTKTADVFQKDGTWRFAINLRGPRGFTGPSGKGGGPIIGTDGDGSSIIVDAGPPPEGGVVGQEILVGSGVPL